MNWRDERDAELTGLKTSAPQQLVALYCRIFHVADTNQVPHIGFNRMIQAILDREEAERQVGQALDKRSA
jgi:hypothetical protein